MDKKEKDLGEYIHKIYVGEGILAQIKPPEPTIIQVEDFYANLREDFWWIIDCLFVDRPDLQERIEKYKKTRRCGHH